MKAAVCVAPNVIRVQDVEAPEGPGPGEAKVATQAAAVCTTDFHIVDGYLPGFCPPLILGHEAAGVITEVGTGVEGLTPGTRVVLEPTIGCGQCFACQEGLGYLCATSCQLIGGTRPGAMAEFFCAPAPNLHPIPDSLDSVSASLLEPLACCVHGMEMVGAVEGKDVLITGAGFSGVLFVQLLRPLARKIVVTGTRDVRLKKSLEFGADAAVDVRKENMLDAGRRCFGQRGPNLIIECSGADGIMEPCIELAARRGAILVYSVILQPQTISMAALQGKEVSMLQVCSCADCLPQAIEIAAAGRVALEPTITHRFKLEDAEEAYRISREEKDLCLKTVVEVPVE